MQQGYLKSTPHPTNTHTKKMLIMHDIIGMKFGGQALSRFCFLGPFFLILSC